MADLRERLQTTLSNAYVVDRELGGGGMSRVFVATDRSLGRRVVLKVLPPELAGGVNVERFRREIQLAALLLHPHIVPLLSAGESDGLPFYTMPFVEGESLRARLARDKTLPLDEAIALAREIASALDYAHRRDIVHRDIKPENVLLHDGHALVTDFGIARAVSAAAAGITMTQAGVALGTPAYMSPEQAMAEREVDGRADLYSLGCVLYEMLTGAPPYSGATAQAIFARHITEAIPLASATRREVPAEVDDAIVTVLAKTPDGRFTTAAEFARALDEPRESSSLPSPARARDRFGEVRTATDPSIVVLPFENLSADADNIYFVDGLTEEIIADLSHIETLRVISRQSAMRLRGTTKDLGAIAQELNVRYVLSGSARKSGTDIRVTAHLVDAVRDAQLWSDRFRGTAADVFDIQERVARATARALHVHVSPREERLIAERPIADLRAYEYYLRAREQIWSFTEASLERALHLIRSGQDIIGDNELLTGAEGIVYWQFVNLGIKPLDTYENYLRRAEDCAARVFRLNPKSAVGHVLRGSIHNNRAQPTAAIREFREAVALDPNNPDALLWLGYSYAISGRCEAAKPLIHTLLQRDPLTPISVFMEGWVAFMEGRRAEARSITRRSYELDLGSLSGKMVMGWMLAADHRVGEACELFDAMVRAAPKMSWSQGVMFMKHSLLGDRKTALQLVTPELQAAAWWDDLFSWMMAVSYAMIDEVDSSVSWLKRLTEFGFINYPFFTKHDPFLVNIREAPPFKELMADVETLWRNFEKESNV